MTKNKNTNVIVVSDDDSDDNILGKKDLADKGEDERKELSGDTKITAENF